MTADTDTLVARLRALASQFLAPDTLNDAANCIEALEGERDAALDIVQGIEIMTATGYGLTPEETSALHWMAQAGRSDTPIIEPTLFSELVKAQEAIVRLIAERDAWKANAEALGKASKALQEDMLERAEIGVVNGHRIVTVNAGRTAWHDFCRALATHEALMKGGA